MIFAEENIGKIIERRLITVTLAITLLFFKFER